MTRRISVALLPSLAAKFSKNQPTAAVVIDTLRFTTTAAQALSVGAASLRVAADIEQARQLATGGSAKALLCGERHCHPIPGFDLGNSPAEYAAEQVSGRELICTTTNGTVAVGAAQGASQVLLAALTNRSAVCRHLQRSRVSEAVVLCAGTDGQVALEDVMTAGAILADLMQPVGSLGTEFTLAGDSARLALSAWRQLRAENATVEELQERIYQRLSEAEGGRNLLDAGFGKDLHFAAHLDSVEAVPIADGDAPSRFRLTGQS